ncbi:manganese resistance protein MNR2 [Roridomyces roridus]|uniref:Manganese resistance protein MNR2 n=1 Tax=Roridomyces roridus TaxID=1738132 RepID=A0AAD7C5E3_9AGAR|nr:manganese resistance protein MNR2 [Roridomyces roridus]
MSSPPQEDVVLSSSPISIRGGSPVRRRTSISRSESDMARSRHSPTLVRSVDPSDPQSLERQRTMDVDMAMQLSRARRETIVSEGGSDGGGAGIPPFSTQEQLDLEIARGGTAAEERPESVVMGMGTTTSSFVDIKHISAHDPSMVVLDSQLRAPPPPIGAGAGGLPTYQPNVSVSEFDYTLMEEFAAAEKALLSLASPKFNLSALRARTVAPDAQDLEGAEEDPSDSAQRASPRRKLSHSNPRPRHHRKGGGGKLAMFEGNTGDHAPAFGGAQSTSGIPGILNTGHDRPYRFSFYSNALSATIHARSLSELPAEGQTFNDLFTGIPPPREESTPRDRDRPPVRPGPSPVVNGDKPRSNFAGYPRHSNTDSESNTWWLDVQNPTDDEMKMLSKASVFSIHPLTTEDIQMEETREKIELFRNYYLVCFRSFDQDPYSPTHLEPLNMYIIVFREGTLSFHFRPTPHPQNVRRRIKQLKDYISVTSDWISYALIDDITDAFGPLIQGIEYEVDSIDELVLILKEKEQSDMLRRIGTCRKKVMGLLRLMGNKADVVKGLAKRCNEHWRVAPTSDIGLYLSDIQDHLITMTQNLNHYEKILSRSHSNYLAQISIEMTDANNHINDVLSKLTALGTVLIPMNLITGLWGMNVHVPGQDDQESFTWFVCIIAALAAIAIIGGYSTYRFMVTRR